MSEKKVYMCKQREEGDLSHNIDLRVEIMYKIH